MNKREVRQFLDDFNEFIQQIQNKSQFKILIERAQNQNAWFEPRSIYAALQWVKTVLSENFFDITISESTSRKILYVPSKGYPLYGFYESILFILNGFKVEITANPIENIFLHLLSEYMEEIGKGASISLSDKPEKNFDLIVVDYQVLTKTMHEYIHNYDNLVIPDLRFNAVITNSWNIFHFEMLADYMLSFFGRTPYNIRNLTLQTTDLIPVIMESTSRYNHLRDHHKYYSKYEFELSKNLLDSAKVYTNQIFTLKESVNLPPISQVNYTIGTTDQQRSKSEDVVYIHQIDEIFTSSQTLKFRLNTINNMLISNLKNVH